MKKTLFFVLMGAALMLTSCKSSKSAYQQAYEKAKAQETYAQTPNQPVQVTPASSETTTPVAPVTDNTPVRSESVVALDGSLKAYSVICGSFSVQTNAEDLCQKLKADGYKAGIVKNVERNMYRVYIGTFNTKAEAVTARDAFKAANPNRQDFQESWILLKK